MHNNNNKNSFASDFKDGVETIQRHVFEYNLYKKDFPALLKQYQEGLITTKDLELIAADLDSVYPDRYFGGDLVYYVLSNKNNI